MFSGTLCPSRRSPHRRGASAPGILARGTRLGAILMFPAAAHGQSPGNLLSAPAEASASMPWLAPWMILQLLLGTVGMFLIFRSVFRFGGPASGQSRSKPGRIMNGAAQFTGWALLFLAAFRVAGTQGIAGVELDQSWPLVMEYGLRHGWQWGKDLVYTMGPLGSFYADVGLGGLSHERTLFAWSQTLFTAYVWWRAGQPLAWWLRLTFWLWVIMFTPSATCLCAAVAVILMTPTQDRMQSSWEAIALPAGCAMLALVKFTELTASLVALGLFAAAGWRCQRRGRLVAAWISFVGFFALGWCATGQTLANLPAYIHSSGEIAFGFHTVSYPPTDLILGWGLATAGSLLLLGVFLTLRAGFIDSALRLAPVFACAFLSWKHGYTRADIHVYLFLSVAFVYACLALAAAWPEPDLGGRKQKRQVLACANALLVLAVSLEALAAAELPGPQELAEALKTRLTKTLPPPWASVVPASALSSASPEQVRQWQLPLTREMAGRTTVDIFNFQQGYAFVNDLNYRSRPIFQSYSAYTPYLQRLNLSFYQSAAAPEHVLFRPGTLDGRLMWLDDAPLMLYLWGHYRPQAREKGFLLLEKSGPATPDEPWTEVRSGQAEWGHKVELPAATDHTWYALRVEARRSFWGRLKRFAYQPANCSISLRLEDGEKINRTFIPELATEGFLLSPWMESVDDLLGWVTDLAVPKNVVSFNLAPWNENEFLPKYHYTLLKRSTPRVDDAAKHRLATFLYPYLPGVPDSMAPPMKSGMRHGHELCFARAPTHLEFSVPPEARGLVGTFAVECAGSAEPQKVTCRALLMDAAQHEIGRYERTLCPQLNPEDELDQTMEFNFPLTSNQAGARLVLESETNATRNRGLTCWGPLSWKQAH
jgi:hypothetical protein